MVSIFTLYIILFHFYMNNMRNFLSRMSSNLNSNAIDLTSPIDQACSIAFLSTQDSSSSLVMNDATTNVDEANQNKGKDVIEENEEEENPFASKKRK